MTDGAESGRDPAIPFAHAAPVVFHSRRQQPQPEIEIAGPAIAQDSSTPQRVQEAVEVPLPSTFPAPSLPASTAATTPMSAKTPFAMEPASPPSGDPSGPATGLWHKFRQVTFKVFDSRKYMSMAARVLLALYFINLVAEQVEVFVRLGGTTPRKRWADDPVNEAMFPYVWVLGVLPAALGVMFGVQVVPCGLGLLATCVLQDAYLLWRQLVNIAWYGHLPNELILKRLAVTGTCILVVADAVKGPQLKSYAGLLFAGEEAHPHDPHEVHPLAPHHPATPTRQQRMAAWRSALLLVSRLALSALLMFSGIMQVMRVRSRGTLWDTSDPAFQHYGIHDSHDNVWQLFQLALAIPLALGIKTKAFCRVVAVLLVCEAVTCWPPWSSVWPSWWYRAHVRLHFATNLALTGALLLLQSSGPGMFAVDELIKRE